MMFHRAAWFLFLVGAFAGNHAVAQKAKDPDAALSNNTAKDADDGLFNNTISDEGAFDIDFDAMNATEGVEGNDTEAEAFEVGSSIAISASNNTDNMTTFTTDFPSAAPTETPTATPSIAPSDYPTIASNADYYDSPKLKWSTKLEGTGLFGPEAKITNGNAVISSPDGSLVYVTLDNGGIHVLSAHDGAPRWSYGPEPLASGWTVSCNSGVYFGKMENGDQYAVYAVVDVPPDDEGLDFSSRIIAISHPTSKHLWISEPIPGRIEGTPIITKVDPGLYVFFTHNQRNMTSGELVGTFSMVNGIDGTMMFTELAGESRVDPDTESLSRVSTLRLPYGPLGVAHEPEWGRYPGGKGNIHDMFIWSTSDLGGRGNNGYTRAFQLPKLFEPEFAPALFTHFLRESRWNAVAAPAVTADGMDVIFGARENKVRGWTGLEDFDKLADMEQSLGKDPNDDLLPVPFSPVLTQSERFVLVTTTTSELHFLRTESGEIVWTVSNDSPLSAKPVVSHDDLYVYATTTNGVIMALDMESGAEIWRITCVDLQATENISESVSRAITSCVDLIDAESSISPNGLVFFYGDKFGNVKALQLGVSTVPTEAPSMFPTFTITSSPSSFPSYTPSQTPTPSPTMSPIDWPELMSLDPRKDKASAMGGKRSGWNGRISALITMFFAWAFLP